MSDLVSASGKPVKIPGPDHPIALTRHPARVVVRAGGQTGRQPQRAHSAGSHLSAGVLLSA